MAIPCRRIQRRSLFTERAACRSSSRSSTSKRTSVEPYRRCFCPVIPTALDHNSSFVFPTNRQLDGQYTAWGHVVEGMEVVDKISESPAGSDQMAQERIEITKAYLRPIPPPQPIPFADATAEVMKRHRVRLVTTLGNH